MGCLPRIAIGSLERDTHHQPVVWALMDVLQRRGLHLQSFLSQSHFAPLDGATVITGQSPRHLDSWSMSRDVCREIFWNGARSCDLAMIEGNFHQEPNGETAAGGTLDALCDWLDSPRIAVLDATRIEGCGMPLNRGNFAGVFLDRVRSHQSRAYLQTIVEGYWGVPVLGMLGDVPAVRAMIDNLTHAGRPSRMLCRMLGRRLEPSLKHRRLLEIASCTDYPDVTPSLFGRATGRRIVVAVPYDECFFRYFPDVLDVLESRGAVIRHFSPLRDDRLPDGTDLVYLGCGQVERFADRLSRNHCMKQALGDHVRCGRRIYAEGGGLAFISRSLINPNGKQFSMAGLLPIVAHRTTDAGGVTPVEARLPRDTWLAQAGASVRGYLNASWRFDVSSPSACHSKARPRQVDIIAAGPIIGSRMHINFASQADLLRRFFHPKRTEPQPAVSTI